MTAARSLLPPFMTFLWPKMLWLLGAVPALVWVYLAFSARGRAVAVRYPALVGASLTPAGRRLRHLPPALLLLGIVALLLGAARPATVVTVPAAQKTVILAIDVSISMLADDIKPNRLAAAKSAAKAFLASQPPSVRIGIVQFGGYAMPAQRPGAGREALVSAIDVLQPQYGTAIGEAILVSLQSAVPGGARASARGAPREPSGEPSAAVILLTDGASTVGTPPLRAARIAADNNVRIYTVGVGTQAGGSVATEAWSMHVGLDEDTLREIARITGGEYLRAESARELRGIYETLKSQVMVDSTAMEVTALFSAAGALALMLSALLSLARSSRIA